MNQPAVKKDKTIPRIPLFSFFKYHSVLAVLIAVLTFVVIYSLMLTAVTPKRYDLAAEDIAPESIAASRDVEDRFATREKVEEAREKVPEFYTLNQTIAASIIGEVHGVFNGIELLRGRAADRLREWEQQQEAATANDADTGADIDRPQEDLVVDIEELYNQEFLDSVKDLIPMELSSEDLLIAITAEQREVNLLKVKLTGVLSEMLETGIKTEQLMEFRNNLEQEIQAMPIASGLKLLGSNIGLPQLQANMLYDPERTMDERQKAADKVEKVMLRKGQFIVQAGQPVTDSQIELLRELGLIKDDYVDIPLYVGIAIIILLIEGFIIFYLVYFEKEIVKKPRTILMISMVLCLVLGLSYITSLFNNYFIPTAMGGMLLTILLRYRIGMVINTALALLAGMMFTGQIGVAIMVLVGGMIGVCLTNTMHHRNTLVCAGLGVSGINVLAISGYEMIVTGVWFTSIYTSLWGIAGGMLAAILTIGTLPLWENLFDVVTPTKLIELANPNHPALKRLLMETPGTYHHSIIVANLAENAADSIGANGLLARVGAYYHDLGKLERPYYFKENQLYTDNPHDRLDPMLSTKIITSHTLDGIELAKRYKVPIIIRDFILQHHGTTPVVYFYHKAKNNSEKEYRLEQFRYQGPKPNSRETAIVMMADTVEAAVRSLAEPTTEKVSTLIRKLIKEKLDDGQMDECELTMKDLDTIALTFSSVIGGIFHERVKYPDVNINEEKEQDQK